MNEAIIIAIITLTSNAVTALITYATTRRKNEADAEQSEQSAHKTAYDALRLAMDVMRTNFENEINSLRAENKVLREEVERLKNRAI